MNKDYIGSISVSILLFAFLIYISLLHPLFFIITAGMAYIYILTYYYSFDPSYAMSSIHRAVILRKPKHPVAFALAVFFLPWLFKKYI